MIPVRCPVCDSSRIFFDDADRLLCHDCGEASYLDSWFVIEDE